MNSVVFGFGEFKYTITIFSGAKGVAIYQLNLGKSKPNLQ